MRTWIRNIIKCKACPYIELFLENYFNNDHLIFKHEIIFEF